MVQTFNMVFLVVLTFLIASAVDAQLEGDVQTKIRVIKEDIKGIKQNEELTKITMMSFMQLVKGVDSRVAEVDSRVTDVGTRVTESTVMVQELSKREDEHYQEVHHNKENIQSLERQSTLVSEKVKELAKEEEEDHQELHQHKEKIELLERQSTVMSEQILNVTKKEEEVHQELHQHKDKIESLELQSTVMLEQLLNVTKKEEEDHQELHQHKEKIESLELQSALVSEQLISLTKKEQLLEQQSQDMKEEIKQLKEKGIVDKLHPIGSIYMTFTNVQPPMNGENGIHWELIPEGYTLMSANTNNVGSQSGEARLDGGHTQGHALTIGEMPSHSHHYNHVYWVKEDRMSGGDRNWDYGTKTYTSESTGGNKAHHHQMNVLNQKVLVWKRTS